MRKASLSRRPTFRGSGSLRHLSAVAVTALCCALTAHARADTCVAIDTSRDGLSEPDRNAARALFEESLADEGVKVTTVDCTETRRVYHVRLGESVTVVWRAASRSRNPRRKPMPPRWAWVSASAGLPEASPGRLPLRPSYADRAKRTL
jgi:hypothetical protein